MLSVVDVDAILEPALLLLPLEVMDVSDFTLPAEMGTYHDLRLRLDSSKHVEDSSWARTKMKVKRNREKE